MGLESNGFTESNILLCSIYMGSVVLLSILSFSEGLDLLKKVSDSVIFVLFVLSTTPDLSGGFKLTTSLKSRSPERMSTISV